MTALSSLPTVFNLDTTLLPVLTLNNSLESTLSNETICVDSDFYQNISCCKKDQFSEMQISYRLLINMPISVGGVFNNIINIIIFTDYQMRRQLVNHFLLVLSIADLLLLICNFLFLIFPVFAVILDNNTLNTIYPIIIRWSYPFALSAQTLSVYMIVFTSVHRFWGIVFPFRAKQYVNATPVRIAIFSAITFSIVVNIFRWGELYVTDCVLPITKNVIMGKTIQLASIMENYYYKLIYKIITYTLTMFLIPFATLIFVNCKIIMALKQSTNLRSKHSRKGDTATGDPTKFTTQFNLLKGSKYSELFTQFANNSNGFRLPRSFLKTQFTNSVRDRSVTLMLLAIVATFFGCNILAFCNNIVEILVDMSADGAASLNQITFEKSVEISNILISLNSATSIFIYIIFSSKFRQTLKIYLGLEKREENVPKKINYVAVTTAMAAHRALDISIIPNEIANHHQIKSTETVQHNFNKQSPHILRSVGAPVKQTQQGDDEEKRGLLCEHTDNSTIIQEETQTVPLNSISQMTITTSTDNEK